ncbi:MAG: hypothetical protein E6I95_08670, partial [Chloroflexi bacterium]
MSDDPREFEVAFRLVSRSAFLLARQLGRSTEESMDIVQDAALRGWRYRSTRIGDFRAWFLAIVYRLSCRRTSSWLPLPANWGPRRVRAQRQQRDSSQRRRVLLRPHSPHGGRVRRRLRTVLFVSIDGKGLDGNPKEFG